jgi:hypothetical protein
MRIEQESLPHLRQFPGDKPAAIQSALQPLPAILDRYSNPYRFESFLNVGQENQARIPAQLAGRDRLCRTFHDDDFAHCLTETGNHDRLQWQYLYGLIAGGSGALAPESSGQAALISLRKWSPCLGSREARTI